MSKITQEIWETALSANDAAAKHPLGTERTEWNSTDACFKKYRYVQAASDTTVANGTVLSHSDTLRQVITSDISDAAPNQLGGVGIGAITASYYGWVQTGGYHSAIITNGDDDIADGDFLIISASADGQCNSVAAGTAYTYEPFGYAVAADVDAANTVAGMITISPV